MTYRQYIVWVAWQDAEWNRPSRADSYAMQTAASIERLIRLTAGQRISIMTDEDIKASNMRLTFAPAPPPEVLAADEEALRENEMIISKQLALIRRGTRLVQEVPMPSADPNGEVEEQPDYSHPRIDPKLAAMINADARGEGDL